MLELVYTTQFKRDFKRITKQGKDPGKLRAVIERLFQQHKLETRHKEHKLSGRLKDYRECHIGPDWLLVYHRTKTELILVRTGSHSELFK